MAFLIAIWMATGDVPRLGQLRHPTPRNLNRGAVRKRLLYYARTGTLALMLPAAALAQVSPKHDLTEVSLEDLMNVQVTSVSKKEQKLSKTAAAVYVITQEDIHRSGATNIPDVLRMVPGVNVAQIDASTWAISIRGFNARYSDKVLVLIDGRTVYTPNFSGVYWDQQNVPLEDIERIEVIRGPGGTVWGANAMNGVINITTRSAKSTSGGLVSAGSGSQETARGLMQYGGQIGKSGSYRAFGQYFNINNSLFPDGSRAADGWHSSHGGFRSDWTLSARDSMTVQGDLFQTREGQTQTVVFSNALPLQRTFNDRMTSDGGNLLGRWNRTLDNGSDMSLQVYYDRYNRLDLGVRDVLNTADLDFHHHFHAGSRHDIVWGLGYRVAGNNITPGYGKTFVPAQRTDKLYSTFVQDEIRLTNSVWLTLGSKFEHNDYTGFEYEPSAQLLWTPTDRQAIWISAGRAIRQASRTDAGIHVDVAAFPLQEGTLAVTSVLGNANTRAERLNDYEVGYRAQVSKQLSLDFAAFASFYRDLLTTNPGDPFFTPDPTPPHLVFPLAFENNARAQTRGGEIFANWNVTHRWRISPGYAVFQGTMTLAPFSQPGVENTANNAPKRQFPIRSSVTLTRNLSWDTALSYVARLDAGGAPSYTRLDTRLGWKIGESVECSIVGQNLLTPQHQEFPDAYEIHHTLVPRTVFGKVTWRF